jgi:hypothetical protein
VDDAACPDALALASVSTARPAPASFGLRGAGRERERREIAEEFFESKGTRTHGGGRARASERARGHRGASAIERRTGPCEERRLRALCRLLWLLGWREAGKRRGVKLPPPTHQRTCQHQVSTRTRGATCAQITPHTSHLSQPFPPIHHNQLGAQPLKNRAGKGANEGCSRTCDALCSCV